MSMSNRLKVLKKIPFGVIGVCLLFVAACALLWNGNSVDKKSDEVSAAQIYFDGEYKIADGEWQPIESGKHIPSTKGDVTVRFNFRFMTPDGEPLEKGVAPIAFYLDHVGMTFYKGERKTHVADNENPAIGESSCGVHWTTYNVLIGSGEPLVAVIHNPHKFGNDNAIDKMLSKIKIGGYPNFSNDVIESGESQRTLGILIVLISLVLLGTALFSSLIHIRNSGIVWILGLVVLFAGAFFTYSADGVCYWGESVISNTIILGISIMFYMLFLMMSIAHFLVVTKKVANITVAAVAVANAVFFVLPIISDALFYDTLFWWAIVQTVANVVLSVSIVIEIINMKEGKRWLYLGAILPLISFIIDVVGTRLGVLSDGVISQYVFIALFAVTVIAVLNLIPRNINAANKAKELEMEKIVLGAELAESRISTMMSQIRPHFIYNTLGSIEQLCKLDPPKAGELVHNFAKYLRGNFGELDNPKPILMSQEMEHVRHYISIENVRFPDMTFTFEMKSDDFHIPALTVQPIVENAIKHGLMKLPKGGTINVVAYETDTAYCVSIIDDGVGFDTDTLLDDRAHVGIRNIRERLKVMVNGTLEIESEIGVGTKVLITIPKEAQR